MPVYTNATYKAMLEQMLNLGVENCWEELPSCINNQHDWQLRENVTTIVDDGRAVITATFPWVIQCAHCDWVCCLR